MLTVSDVELIENSEEADEAYFETMQRAINDGSAWSFQGNWGRSMMDAIEGGFCCLGREPCRDYYGNRIPSRDEVQEGTKGSVGFVREMRGEDWAEMISAV